MRSFIFFTLFFFSTQTEINSNNSCPSVSQKEEFLRHVPTHTCHQDSGKPWFTADVLGNYEPFPPEEEGGGPVHVPGAEFSLDMYEYGMSMTVSDSIPLWRGVRDLRVAGCRNWNYPEQLPAASVVIVFHNEGLSVILRTVVSVLKRSPAQFLHEVLLVDDRSDLVNYPHLGSQLEDWVNLEAKVRLIRNSERQGLIRSKNKGAENARGEVVIFLDAHCEVNINWLPPLLAPIERDPTTLTVPIVDSIDYLTFEYTSVYRNNVRPSGIWEWGLLYKEYLLPEDDLTDRERSAPYPSPLHAGGLIAVNRKYFLSLGGYDPGLQVWGGEQYELSYKIWMCGGRILWVPCSRVGHVYRKFSPYDMGATGKTPEETVEANLRRVVETWFDDEHKQYFYTRLPLAKYSEYGDISQQLRFRSTCRPFSWFMQNQASQVYLDFPRLPPNLLWGRVSLKSKNICWKFLCQEPPCKIKSSRSCEVERKLVYRLNTEGQLALGERCVVPVVQEQNSKSVVELGLERCALGTVNDNWSYNDETGQLSYEAETETGERVVICVQHVGVEKILQFRSCDSKEEKQKWRWQSL